MFDTLIESGHHAARPRPLGSGAVALLAHVTLGVAGVWATLQPRGVVAAEGTPPIILWPNQSQPREPSGPGALVPGPVGTIPDVPVEVPAGLPPIDSDAPFDAERFLRDGTGVALPADANGAWDATLVDEQPVLLASRSPAYPEMLRRAGIEGRVVVQAVVDTLGRAEAGSVFVVESPNPGFDAPARDYVRHALFRPARAHGRAVRVLVRVPIDFTLRGLH